MTPNKSSIVTLLFGDNNYSMGLSWQQVSDWEKRSSQSMFAAFQTALAARAAPLDLVRDVLHMGLIGGGMTPAGATAHVRTYVEQRPVSETFPITLAVLEAFFFGNDDYRAEKAKAGGDAG